MADNDIANRRTTAARQVERAEESVSVAAHDFAEADREYKAVYARHAQLYSRLDAARGRLAEAQQHLAEVYGLTLAEKPRDEGVEVLG